MRQYPLLLIIPRLGSHLTLLAGGLQHIRTYVHTHVCTSTKRPRIMPNYTVICPRSRGGNTDEEGPASRRLHMIHVHTGHHCRIIPTVHPPPHTHDSPGRWYSAHLLSKLHRDEPDTFGNVELLDVANAACLTPIVATYGQ